MDDLRYPHVAGHRGLGGSVEAAQLVTPSLPRLQALVIEVVERAGAYGATSDEIAAALEWDRYRVRPRTSELRKLGRIADSRKRRQSEAGVASIVWTLPKFVGPLTIGSVTR